jgi:hypothetical protein
MIDSTRQSLTKPKKDAGFVTVDFLFSIMISATFCSIMFVLCFTFTVVEISQYIAFSVSRAHLAGHLDQSAQENLAKGKFAALINNPVFAPLYKNGWFELTGPDIRGGGESGKTFEDVYPAQKNVAQVGVRLLFNAKIMVLKVPILGSTAAPDTEFTAFVTGLLIREPTTKECQDQISGRWPAIRDLDRSRFNIVNQYAERNYVPMEDNGC